MATSKKAGKRPARTANAKTTASRRRSKPASPVRARPETLRIRSASPSFTVNDIGKSLAWYCDVLGFAAGERWEIEGKLAGVELKAGNVGFMIGQDDWKKGRDRRKGEGFRIYCETTQDIDVLAEAIQARGGVLDHGPRDEPWGVRDFAVTDPDGFKITIAAQIRKR